MRASCVATLGCVLAVLTAFAERAEAAYPFDSVPALPPLAGVGSSAGAYAPPAVYDPDLTVPGDYGGGGYNSGFQGPGSTDPGYGFGEGANYYPDDGSLDDGYLDDAYLDDDPYLDPPRGLDSVFSSGEPLWVGYLATSYQPGTDRFLWNGDLFLPLWQDGRTLWFFDVRGQFDDKDAGEFNIGTGIRTLAKPGLVFGTYLFFDRLYSSNDNSFSQGTFGVEVMDVFWDVRFNVYFPESKLKATSTPPSASISNGTILVSSGLEAAYWGLDFETGALLGAWGPNAQHELRGFLGLYHFDHSAAGFDNITGPRARIEWRYHDIPMLGNGSRLTAGFTLQADTERGGDAFAFIGLRVPLDPWAHSRRPLSRLTRRMVDPVVRDVDVVSNVIGRSEPAINPHTGKTIESVRVLDQSDDLADLIPAAGENSVVVIDGTDGDLYSDSSINLVNGQTVLGGGMQFAVTGEQTGYQATWTAPGRRPTVEFGAAGGGGDYGHAPPAGFVMADHTFLKGLDIRSGQPAVHVNHAEHVYISDVSVRDAYGTGIAVQHASHVDIDGVTIDEVHEAAQDAGYWGAPSNADDSLDTATFLQQGTGIAVIDSSDVAIRNSLIKITAGPGIALSNTERVTMENVELKNVGTAPDALDPDGGSVSFTSWAIPPGWTPQHAGIVLSDTSETMLSDVTLKHTGTYGVWANGAVSTTIDGITINGVTQGLAFADSRHLSVSQAFITLPGEGAGWAVYDAEPHYGIKLLDMSDDTEIINSEISGGVTGNSLWVRNGGSQSLDLTVSDNMLGGNPVHLETYGSSHLTARISGNVIGSEGAVVSIDGAGDGTSSIGLFDNQINGLVNATAWGDRELNLVLHDNQLGAGVGPHTVSNLEDASIYFLYRENRTANDVAFESGGSLFGLEPFVGNNHTPMLDGDFDNLPAGTLQSRAPELFD